MSDLITIATIICIYCFIINLHQQIHINKHNITQLVREVYSNVTFSCDEIIVVVLGVSDQPEVIGFIVDYFCLACYFQADSILTILLCNAFNHMQRRSRE